MKIKNFSTHCSSYNLREVRFRREKFSVPTFPASDDETVNFHFHRELMDVVGMQKCIVWAR